MWEPECCFPYSASDSSSVKCLFPSLLSTTPALYRWAISVLGGSSTEALAVTRLEVGWVWKGHLNLFLFLFFSLSSSRPPLLPPFFLFIFINRTKSLFHRHLHNAYNVLCSHIRPCHFPLSPFLLPQFFPLPQIAPHLLLYLLNKSGPYV